MSTPYPTSPTPIATRAPWDLARDYATWSLISGILTWVVCPVVGAVLAVIFGILSARRAHDVGQSPPGTAVAGLILGGVQVGGIAVFTAIFLFLVILGTILEPSHKP